MIPPRGLRLPPDDGLAAIENAHRAEQRLRLVSLLAARYGASGAELAPFYEEADKAVYRVDHGDADPWVLRLFPAARPSERVEGDAAVLRYLEEHGVPAERVVRADDGALTTRLDGRVVLVTGLVFGARPDRAPATLRLLGEAVGRFHALPSVPADAPLLTRRAGALPREDLAFGRACLARVAGRVPPDRRAEEETLAAALDRTHDCEDLPRGLTQSDRHLGNALRTPDGAVVLFDWEGAGQGPLLPALGWLLFSCVVQAPDDPPIPPDLGRVESLIEGYCRRRIPTAGEVARLADAVRVRPLVVAAREFGASVERDGRPDGGAWWARYAEAEAVAASARRALERWR